MSSSAQPFAVRVEERAQPYVRRLERAVDLDLDLRAFLRELGRHPGDADRLRQLAAPARARHAPGRPPVDDALPALGRDDAVRHLEADELLAEAAVANVVERRAADEVVLVPLDEPG